MGRRPRATEGLDTELAELPPELRWREWMGRVEAVIFASAEPVMRETLARLVGRDCSVDLLIDDIREELRDRPYELVSVAGGWQHRTRQRFAEAIRSVTAVEQPGRLLSQADLLVLAIVAYHQPITRGEISKITGKEVSRDTIAHLRSLGVVASGPRSPQPGAPYTLVTTKTFLSQFGFETLRDLPNIEALEDAGLLSKHMLFDADIPIASDERNEPVDQDAHDR
ncbi:MULTISPECIES: SMC-Scp complex subunit ScpB [Rhizobium]|uniref:SMC-Scp complex subunit ScpB n=1 Tax=Rhizobium tropici TaxID=398 RepID=A0A6P1C723_RHITR|nr:MULTISPECIES: SMC-Scp complex subunit ScpB [Rhizobium]AGB73111.1 segregation and condensation protein B [Rhizobium tropici CIAT 899]MBB4243613.1 segregation and condensation protein B [Rhizobium tropici]MBB5595938.1 segregation and condensation protein B [Rhizobium tropici]MBB6493931.1 segregation and condensation protein B [Rhizobium tropici]NEV11363.1 SMC-Scp complex subunit ScpB [Rhizobium tropici]